MLNVVLRYADGEVMEIGPFATFSDAFRFVLYMAQFDTLHSVKVVRKNG